MSQIIKLCWALFDSWMNTLFQMASGIDSCLWSELTYIILLHIRLGFKCFSAFFSIFCYITLNIQFAVTVKPYVWYFPSSVVTLGKFHHLVVLNTGPLHWLRYVHFHSCSLLFKIFLPGTVPFGVPLEIPSKAVSQSGGVQCVRVVCCDLDLDAHSVCLTGLLNS